MNFEDAFVCQQITESRNRIDEIRGGITSTNELKGVIEKASTAAAELKELKEGFADDTPKTMISYTDASIKCMESVAFSLGLVMNGLESLNRAVEKYDTECDNMIKAIEDKSGEKFDPAHEKAVQENLAEDLAKMLFGALMAAVAEGGMEAWDNDEDEDDDDDDETDDDEDDDEDDEDGTEEK